MNAVAQKAVSSGLSHRGLITVSVMLASILQALDATIANVALPHIQGNLSATQEQMGWVLTSYIVAAAIMTPLAGWLTGPVGRKKIFVFSIAGFTIASALCGIAQSLGELVVFRLIQGLAGASLVPLSQAVLLDIYPKEQHGRATAMWAMGITVGPILGPALGGWLTEYHSWRWVFLINIPFGILALLGVISFLKETKTKYAPFDFFGFVTLSLAIGALQIMLDRGQLQDWFSSTEIVIETAIAGLALYLFIVHMLTARHPFVSPALFRDRNFAISSVFIFVIGVVLFATLALLPPMLQGLMNYPVVTTGLITAPRGVGGFLSMIVVGRLIGKFDPRTLITFGLGLTALSLWMMTGFSPQMDSGPVIWSGFIQGLGMGFVWVPLSTAAFATLSLQLRNEGTSMFNLLRNIGSSIGIAVVVALLTRNTQIMHSQLGEHITPYDLATRFHPAFDAATPAGLSAINATVTQQAAMIAYNNDFKLLLILTVVIVPLVFLLRGVRGKSAPSVAAE
jgi:MFS transporter, DHA2 family, multidrug resistance protein